MDDMDLPLANRNEELETTSSNHFRLLFEPEKFAIRPENDKDKGVDFFIELKKDGKHLNFRFAVQLKATKSIEKNGDGSFSLSIKSSNIHYLLNSGIPAYYVLYVHDSGKFYYEPLVDFVRQLNSKDDDWIHQSTHVLRFHKLLDISGVNSIYSSTYNWGKNQRSLLELIISQTSITNPNDKLILDVDLSIASDKKIRESIEAAGLALINEGRWKDILFLHAKGSIGIASTAKYNLVVGIAHYYYGNLSESLSYLRKALGLKSQLATDLQNYLEFMNAIVKYSIGILSNEEYESEITKLEADENIASQIRLEKAKKDFLNIGSESNIDSKFEEFRSQVLTVINNQAVHMGTKLNARCELIFISGHYNNIVYFKSVANLNAYETMIGPDRKLRQDIIAATNSSYEEWRKSIEELQQTAVETKNYFAFFNTEVNQARVQYEFYVFTDSLYIGQSTNTPHAPSNDKKVVIGPLLTKVNGAVDYFEKVSHLENMLSALTLKYEMLHYIEDFISAGKILQEVEGLANNFELKEIKRKLNLLKNSGTTHQRFKFLLNEIFEKGKNDNEESEKIKKEILRMDVEDEKVPWLRENDLAIQLHPIGLFAFPKSRLEKVYEILGITDSEIKSRFNALYEMGATPIANIYNDPIIEEGYGELMTTTGLKTLKSLYRIRRLFFENKFVRFQTSMPR